MPGTTFEANKSNSLHQCLLPLLKTPSKNDIDKLKDMFTPKYKMANMMVLNVPIAAVTVSRHSSWSIYLNFAVPEFQILQFLSTFRNVTYSLNQNYGLPVEFILNAINFLLGQFNAYQYMSSIILHP